MKPDFPECNKEFVQKKIQGLRGSFRKEMNKVTVSKRSGKGTEEIYVPTLWYYDQMSFTLNQETPSTSMSNIDEAPRVSFTEESSEVEVDGTAICNIEDAEACVIEKEPAESATQPDDRVSCLFYYYY